MHFFPFVALVRDPALVADRIALFGATRVMGETSSFMSFRHLRHSRHFCYL
jgi:hypothetical protein